MSEVWSHWKQNTLKSRFKRYEKKALLDDNSVSTSTNEYFKINQKYSQKNFKQFDGFQAYTSKSALTNNQYKKNKDKFRSYDDDNALNYNTKIIRNIEHNENSMLSSLICSTEEIEHTEDAFVENSDSNNSIDNINEKINLESNINSQSNFVRNNLHKQHKGRNRKKPLIHIQNESIIDIETNNNKNICNSLLNNYKDLSESHIQQVLSCIIPKDTLNVCEDDIVGLTEVKKMIKTKIFRPLLKPEVHKGLYRPCTGILFFGPPGTGKTTLAKWIATTCNASFFNITPATLISKFHGETESLIKALFCTAAETSPSIIFIDEIDSILGKRTDKEEDTIIRMKNQFLQLMDGICNDISKLCIVIGATNRPEALDEAALRRLSKRIYISLPDEEAIASQIVKQLVNHASELGIEYENNNNLEWIQALAKTMVGYNGSDIQGVCIKAAEYVYEAVLEKYGDSLSQLETNMFWIPGYEEFCRALKSVKPTGLMSKKNESIWVDWTNEFSCT